MTKEEIDKVKNLAVDEVIQNIRLANLGKFRLALLKTATPNFLRHLNQILQLSK